MGFFTGGYKWETNPGLAQANAYGQQGVDAWANARAGTGDRRLIRASNHGGEMSNILGDPFLAQQAANDRLAASHADAFLPPELAQAQVRNAQAHNAEQAGINFENYVRQSVEAAKNRRQGFNLAQAGGESNAYQHMADNQIGGHQGHQTESGLSVLGQIAQIGSAVAGAGAGLGWSPFEPK